MHDRNSQSVTPATRVAFLIIFAIGLLPLLSTPLLPFIDLYNHIARYFVLAHLDTSPLLGRYYQAHWSLLPNIGLDVVATQLLRVLPATLAAHVVVVAIFAVQYGGLLTFNQALTGRRSLLVALLAIPLLYSFILNWGFANFLLGLGLVFWSGAWWLAQRHRLAVALPVAVALAVMVYLTHGLAFALYGILVGCLEIGLWLQHRPRSLQGLVKALAPLAAQAVIPVLLFAAASTSKSATGLTNADESISRLAAAGELSTRLGDLFWHRLLTIVRVEEGPLLWLDIVTIVAQAAIIGMLLLRGRVKFARPAWPVIAVAAMLVVVVPPAMFGVGYVADRIPLFLAMLLVGSLAVAPGRDRLQRLAVLGIAAIVAVRLAATAIGWQAYAQDYDDFRRIAALIPPGSLVDDIIVGGMQRDSDDLRCPMYRPLLISMDGQIGSLFANDTQQPLRLIGPLRTTLSAMPSGRASGNMRPGFYDDSVAAAGPAGFGYVIICNAERLTRPLPSSAIVLARTPRFILLRLSR